MPEINSLKDKVTPADLHHAIKAFAAISAQCNQSELASIMGAVWNAINQGELSDLALHISKYARQNGLDKELDFSDLKGVQV
jgi:hypothetical protein